MVSAGAGYSYLSSAAATGEGAGVYTSYKFKEYNKVPFKESYYFLAPLRFIYSNSEVLFYSMWLTEEFPWVWSVEF